MRLILVLPAIAILGCYSSAERYTDKPMKQFDDHTEYRVEEGDDGFTLFVYHKRYQMFGNDSKLIATGMTAAETIALKEASARGKQIEELDRTSIKQNTGRDAAANSSWSAVIPVRYKKP